MRSTKIVATIGPSSQEHDVLTAMIVASWYLHLGLGPGRTQVLLTIRNLSVFAIVGAYFVLSPRESEDLA